MRQTTLKSLRMKHFSSLSSLNQMPPRTRLKTESSFSHENYLGPVSATPQLMCERIVDAIFPPRSPSTSSSKSSKTKTNLFNGDGDGDEKKQVLVYDLGCNDARVLIAACQKNTHVRGIGVEIDPVAASNAKKNVQKMNLDERVEIRMQDAMTVTDVHRADYVFLYLLPKGNEKVAKLLRERMNDRCRVICYMFKLPDDQNDDKFWEKRLMKEVAFEDSRKRERKGVDSSRYNRIYVYGSKRETERREKIRGIVRVGVAVVVGIVFGKLKLW